MSGAAVSVVIPTYNRAHLVPRAIDSALAALSPGDEIVVVDDGSSDDTVAVVEAIEGPIRLLEAAHGGAGAARNVGIAAARGPLIAFLDSDDEWLPDKVELQRAFLERRPDVLFCFGDFGVRLEDGTEHRRYLPQWFNQPRPLAEVFGPGDPYSETADLPDGRRDFPVYVGSMYRREMRSNFVAAFTLMVRKEEAGEDLHFAEDLPICEEWATFGRLARRGPGALFDTELAWQYGHSGPRVTGASLNQFASGWLTALDNVWGRDPDFLANHGDEYRDAILEARMMRAFAQAREGSPRAAGRLLRLAAGDPAAFRVFLGGIFDRPAAQNRRRRRRGTGA